MTTCRDLIRSALRAYGRLTREQLCAYTGLSTSTVSSCLHRLQQRPGRCVRIADWRDVSTVTRSYLRPVYQWSNRPDAPRPDPVARRRASWLAYYHRAKPRYAHAPASVFDLARYL